MLRSLTGCGQRHLKAAIPLCMLNFPIHVKAMRNLGLEQRAMDADTNVDCEPMPFGFIIHPLDAKKDIARRFPFLGRLPSFFIHWLSRYLPCMTISHVTGIRSQATRAALEGWLVACPMTPRRMLSVPTETAYRKVVKAGHLAQQLGAGIVGLGGFTSVVGDAGKTIASRLEMPVTTGNSYTAAVTIHALTMAAEQHGIAVENAIAAVVGASGSIGKACAKLLLPKVAEVIVLGRSPERLQQLVSDIGRQEKATVTIGESMSDLRRSKLIIAATSAQRAIIEPEHLDADAVICDVARPFNVSETVKRERPEVRVINGGMVRVPGAVDFKFDFGMPAGMAFACMAETMVLALENRSENFTLGREINTQKVEEIDQLAIKHGFEVALA
jgi:fatty aldehyde-generating acyl-ACP reductase